jgi:FkbM family methyltransferase
MKKINFFLKKLKYLTKKIYFFRIVSYFILPRYKPFKKLTLNKDSLIIDLGANIGDKTQYFHDRYKCKIICYEPNKIAFNILEKRFHKLSNIICINKGVSKNEKEKKLYHHKEYENDKLDFSQGSSFLENKSNVNSKNFDYVQTLPISELLDEHKYIDLIKIDIEGYEYEIIPELITNKSKIKYVIAELHGDPVIKNYDNTQKNKNLEKKYMNLVSLLKDKELFESWFFQYY